MSGRWRRLVGWLRERPGRALAVLAGTVAVVLALGYGGLHLWAGYHYRAARQALERHRLPSAQRHVRDCLKVWPDDADALFLAARIERRAGKLDEAERLLNEYERVQPGPSEALVFERALLRAQRGEFIGPVERYLLAQIDRKHPETPLIREALAWGYEVNLCLPTAQHHLDLILKDQPDNIPVLLHRGRLTAIKIDALTFFRRAVALDPDLDEARLNLAEALVNSGELDEGRSQYRVLHQRQPNDPAVLFGLARCAYLANDFDQARELFDQTLALDEKNAAVLVARGRLELEAGNGAEAERWLRQSLRLDFTDQDANHLLYQCLQKQGKGAEAKEQLARLERLVADLKRLGQIMAEELNRRPNDPDLQSELGILYLRNGQDNKGRYWLFRALDQNPAHRQAHQALADYYRGKGDLEMAADHERQAQ